MYPYLCAALLMKTSGLARKRCDISAIRNFILSFYLEANIMLRTAFRIVSGILAVV